MAFYYQNHWHILLPSNGIFLYILFLLATIQHYERCHLYLLATGASLFVHRSFYSSHFFCTQRAGYSLLAIWDKLYTKSKMEICTFCSSISPVYSLWVLTMFKHLVYTLFGALYLIKILPQNERCAYKSSPVLNKYCMINIWKNENEQQQKRDQTV